MDNSDFNSNQPICQPKDSIIIVVGNTTYTVEQVYTGSRTVQEVMGDFLEREVRNLSN